MDFVIGMLIAVGAIFVLTVGMRGFVSVRFDWWWTRK